MSVVVSIVGIFVLVCLIVRIYTKISETISKKADALAEKKVAAIHDQKRQFYEGLKGAFEESYVNGRQWLATYIAEALRTIDEAEYKALLHKKRPARKAAEELRDVKADRRETFKQLKLLQYQIASHKEYFPILEEYEEPILNDNRLSLIPGISFQDSDENADRAILFLRDDEYQRLSVCDRNQLALGRYVMRNKPNWEIGRFYERFIGYRYESEGWEVEYFGAIKGFEDFGRDLVCKRNDATEIIQAKCWSAKKVIREKHIFQLYGTTVCYEAENNLTAGSVKSVFITTTMLSDFAAKVADRLGISIRQLPVSTDYPMIKCNINQESKIYHLPFDQQYDRVKICNKGERYVKTVAEAEKLGFRRAKRYFG